MEKHRAGGAKGGTPARHTPPFRGFCGKGLQPPALRPPARKGRPGFAPGQSGVGRLGPAAAPGCFGPVFPFETQRVQKSCTFPAVSGGRPSAALSRGGGHPGKGPSPLRKSPVGIVPPSPKGKRPPAERAALPSGRGSLQKAFWCSAFTKRRPLRRDNPPPA